MKLGKFKVDFVLKTLLCLAFVPLACSDDATFNNLAGIPAEVRIIVDPGQSRYYQEDIVTVTAIVYDALNTRVDDIELNWSQPSSTQVSSLGDNQFEFIQPGEHTWTVNLPAPYEPITDSVTLTCWTRPARIEITTDPELSAYQIGSQVTMDFVVYDKDDNALSGFEADWTVPGPQDVASLGNGVFQFVNSGDFTWSVALQAPFEDITDSKTLSCSLVPVSVEITVNPNQLHFAPSDEIELAYLVYDSEGGVIPGIEADWTNPTNSQVQSLGNNFYRFIDEGSFEWTVTLVEPWTNISDSLTLFVDVSGPQISVLTPERGDTILKSGPDNTQVEVSGNVSDVVSGLSQLTFSSNLASDIPINVENDGSFSHLMNTEVGLNVITLNATDSAGNQSLVTRSFFMASDYFKYQDDLQNRLEIPNVFDGLITNRALDKGTPFDIPPYDTCSFGQDGVFRCDSIQDIASLLELALNYVDFAEMQTDLLYVEVPLTNETFSVHISDIIGNLAATITGTFVFEIAFSEIAAGEAQVYLLQSTNGGIYELASFNSYTDTQGQDQAGMTISIGISGTLTYDITLDWDTGSPVGTLLACLGLATFCDGNGICAHEYVASCMDPSPPRSIASSVSTIEAAPVAASIEIDDVGFDADFLVGLDQDNQADVELQDLTVLLTSFTSDDIDLSGMEGIEINLGTITIATLEIELGTYTIGTAFINDMINAIFDPIVETLSIALDAYLSWFYDCQDPDNPLCFVIPFFEDLLGSYSIAAALEYDNPFTNGPLINVDFNTVFSSINFSETSFGKMNLAARVDSQIGAELTSHMDDDFLGLPLIAGCNTIDPGFSGHSTDDKAIQMATSIDMYNMFLKAVWFNGGMDLDINQAALDLDPQLNISNITLITKPWLPIIINHCAGLVDYLEAQLGDWQLDITFTKDNVSYVVSGFLGLILPANLSLGLDGKPALELDTSDIQNFAFEIQQLTVGGQPATADDYDLINELVRDHLGPQLINAYTNFMISALCEQLILDYDASAFPGLEPGQNQLLINNFGTAQSQGRIILNGEINQ
jgi:hypothetical protein